MEWKTGILGVTYPELCEGSGQFIRGTGMDKKYLVFPGKVISRHDGDSHFITADKLIRLFGVKREECIIINSLDEAGRIMNTEPGFQKMIHLSPRWDGDYTLPNANKLDELRDGKPG